MRSWTIHIVAIRPLHHVTNCAGRFKEVTTLGCLNVVDYELSVKMPQKEHSKHFHKGHMRKSFFSNKIILKIIHILGCMLQNETVLVNQYFDK